MNIERYYIGYTKDGKEHVFYSRMGYYTNGVATTDYVDLETKKAYSGGEIDNLRQFNKFIEFDKRRATKRKVKKVYQADRNKLIDVQALFYGTLINRDSDYPSRYYMESPVHENVLFTRLNDPNFRVMDLHTSKMYPRRERTLRGYAVQNDREINYEQFDEVMQPKRKVLEMDYRKEL